MAGDWHGNTAWALNLIRRLPELLPGEETPLVLQLGDFGVWPGPRGDKYLRKLDRILGDVGGVLGFVDGNHEWFPALEQIPTVAGKGWLRDRIWHLRRGHRWTWHDRTWCALGGAVSLDKAMRTEGLDWWPQEEITPAQVHHVAHDGPVDVLVTHECPAAVLHEFPAPPSWWAAEDLVRNTQHRVRLQTVVDEVRPGWLFHGHLHRGYHRHLPTPREGGLHVHGLDADRAAAGAWLVLNVQTMEVEQIHGAGSVRE
ncbi:hypothetical protein EDD29_0097 [Actinocorallia herbida]|uniref:Calcineurin-like phosphoesterase family protein n=1 Tax=Actinocorallia herbida TaxID=58109 RepID=A0A3N1CMR3_9ACTN|nr:hypothetical protein EDD29_0097 [Actinocorallia herbida]